MPALIGLAEAQVGLNNDGQAIAALERVLAIDPKREAVRTRFELVRFRMVQSLIDEGRRARQANRLDVAEQAFEQALAVSPSSTLILRELAQVELRAGRADDAEGARATGDEAGSRATPRATRRLAKCSRRAAGSVTPRRRIGGRSSIDDRPEWRRMAADLSEKADMAALPREFGNLSATTTITRAHVAAYVGIRLGTFIEAAPRRAVAVATDVGRHWASPWILPVTRAGVMNVYRESHVPARHGGAARGSGADDGATDRAGGARPLHRALRLARDEAAVSGSAAVQCLLPAGRARGHGWRDVR